MRETPAKLTPIFARADDRSGSNYTCNGCGSQWGDHIAPGCQCPGSSQIQTASEKAKISDERVAGIEKFATDAWNHHQSGLAIIEPLSKILKAKIIGADSDCFPLYASSVRVEGHGDVSYWFCMTNGGTGLCTVMSALDVNAKASMTPSVVAYNKVESFLPAVRKHLYCVSRAGDVGESAHGLEDYFEPQTVNDCPRG